MLVRVSATRAGRAVQMVAVCAGLGTLFHHWPVLQLIERKVLSVCSGSAPLESLVNQALDLDDLVRQAREQSILLAKGALFSPARAGNQRLRFNAACSAAPELVRFLTESARAAA